MKVEQWQFFFTCYLCTSLCLRRGVMAKFTTQDATLAQLDFKWVKLHTCVPKGQVLSLMSKQRIIIDTVLSIVLSMAQVTGIFAA